jgi:hypothetical protein
MNLLVLVLLAACGLGALLFVWRAVSCARFNRALRSYVPAADRGHAVIIVEAEVPSGVVDARRRFEARARDSSVAKRPRSA